MNPARRSMLTALAFGFFACFLRPLWSRAEKPKALLEVRRIPWSDCGRLQFHGIYRGDDLIAMEVTWEKVDTRMTEEHHRFHQIRYPNRSPMLSPSWDEVIPWKISGGSGMQQLRFDDPEHLAMLATLDRVFALTDYEYSRWFDVVTKVFGHRTAAYALRTVGIVGRAWAEARLRNPLHRHAR